MVTELMGGGDVEGLMEKAPDHRIRFERSIRSRENEAEKTIVDLEIKISASSRGLALVRIPSPCTPLDPVHTYQGALWLKGGYESPGVGISSLKRKVGSFTLVAWARPVMGRLSGSSSPSWTNTPA